MSEHIFTASGLKIVHILPKVLAVLRLPEDWTNKDDVAEWLIAVAELFDEIAAVTPNDIDNKIASYARLLATNGHFIALVISIIERLQDNYEPQSRRRVFTEAKIPDELSTDPVIVTMILDLLVDIVELVKTM